MTLKIRKRTEDNPALKKAFSGRNGAWLAVASAFLMFFAFSVCGWIFEEIISLMHNGCLTNRGILYGPYCPIYGVGGLLVIAAVGRRRFFLNEFEITPFIDFVKIGIIATVTELIGSYVMEAITGSFMWDYSNMRFNFEGRVAAFSSFRFCILGMVGIYAVRPLIRRFSAKHRNAAFGTALLLLFIIMEDVFLTFA